MAVTMVGMDWGMAALGMSGTPRKQGETVVRAEDLTKRYGEHAAVSNISFEVQRGDVYALLGPTGSGKSTTIEMVLGLVQASSGAIESSTFYPCVSGRDNLKALGRLRPGVSNARIDEVLETVGLRDAAGKHYGNYSLGMKQRLGSGWAMLHDPELLVLDEPTNGIDPAGMMDASWPVVLGRRDRDIITLQGQDA